jgi:hypothetical protein
MPFILGSILLLVALGLALYAFLGKAAADKRANKAFFAAGVAVQSLRELQRNVLPGSDDQFSLNQSLKEIESAISLAKDN